ncbi:MAG: sugar phosphate isomerase/epimerase [Clostridia bacterium]|nr:sugar phosphate isomerase/epimerase [Clostridia bacterium]
MLEVGVQNTGWFSWDDLDGSFARFKADGFETVDLGFPGVAFDPEKPIESFYDQPLEDILAKYRPVKEAADRYGITVSQSHAPFPLWLKGEDTYNAYMIMVLEKLCAVCEAIGCPHMVAHPINRTLKENEWSTNMELYRAILPTAKRHGVKICLENLFTVHTGRVLEGVCADAEEACRYVDALNAEAGAEVFGFCFDVGHANLLHKDLRRYINTLGHRLSILHIHDNDGQNDLHLMPYTQSRYRQVCTNALDWESFILGLKDIGYRGTLCFETFRVIRVTPKELWDSSLTHLSNIGRYFRDRILAPDGEASE